MQRWDGALQRMGGARGLAWACVVGLIVSSEVELKEVQSGGIPQWLLHKLVYEEPNRHLQELGQISDVEGSLVRTFLSPAHMRAASLLRRWMREAGMRTWMDAVGNVHGRVNGADPRAPVLLMGSHYDTVVDAGKYDGALGIITAIAAVKATLLHAALASRVLQGNEIKEGPGNLDLGSKLGNAAKSLTAFPLEVIAFCDEEGVRFQTTFLGSRAVTGALLREGMLTNMDGNGMSLREVLFMHGFDGSEAAVAAIAMDPAHVRGYLELHMEQGPVLESTGQALGPVSAIAGQTRLAVQVHGVQGHAGTVPMSLRHDPVPAVGEATLAIEQRCGGYPAQRQLAPDTLPPPEVVHHLVCTVGSVVLWPGASNVIAGSANFSIDIRARDDDVRLRAVTDIWSTVEGVCARRSLRCSIETKHEAPSMHSDPVMIDGILSAITASRQVLTQILSEDELRVGKASPGGPAIETEEFVDDDTRGEAATPGGVRGDAGLPVLVSGAGHDALAMSELTKVGMIFVRDKAGISHSPLEYVREPDVAAAVAALYMYLVSDALPPASPKKGHVIQASHEEL